MRLKVQRLTAAEKLKGTKPASSEAEPEHTEAVSGVGWLNAEEVLSAGDDQILRWNISTGKAQTVNVGSLNNA